MSKSVKDIVTSFYTIDLIRNLSVFSEHLHPEIELYWNSSFGFHKKDFQSIISMFTEMSSSFEALRCEISHIIAEGNTVTVRYTYFVKTIEVPDKEETLAHFITIWELKEGKLYRGYQISQQGDNSTENRMSFISK